MRGYFVVEENPLDIRLIVSIYIFILEFQKDGINFEFVNNFIIYIMYFSISYFP